jgi:hypothetical protein
MYAFGLEENGQYRRAEKLARRALAIDPQHPGAVHVIAHVMEMQGRFREGLAFLAATEPAWAEGTGFSVHLAWHRALFHLDANDPGSAIAVYDAQIANERAPGMPCSPMLLRCFGGSNSETSRWVGDGPCWPIAGRCRPWPVRGPSMSFTP